MLKTNDNIGREVTFNALVCRKILHGGGDGAGWVVCVLQTLCVLYRKMKK